MAESLYPANDVDYTVLLEDINQITGNREPVVSGAVTAFIGDSDDATGAADPALVGTATHVGVTTPDEDEPYPLGTWLVHFDRDDLDIDLLDSLFGESDSPKPYLIVDDPAGARVYLPLKYVRTRKALVAES